MGFCVLFFFAAISSFAYGYALLKTKTRFYWRKSMKLNNPLHLTLQDFPIDSDASNFLLDKTDLTSSTIDTINTALLSNNDLQSSVGLLLAGAAFLTYENRPRGSAQEELIEVRRSSKISNNLGVVAKTFIPAGTIIGTYPGYLRKVDDFLKSSKFSFLPFKPSKISLSNPKYHFQTF
jgi:hypothetical protein